MYWVAHLVYLISPFVAHWEQVDRRIVLSLLGLRFINIEVNFYYLNASWWFFSMLIQFYFIFPLLFRMAQRLGPWTFLSSRAQLGSSHAISCSLFIRKTVHGYSAALPLVDCRSSRWVWRWECGTLGRPDAPNGSSFAAQD